MTLHQVAELNELVAILALLITIALAIASIRFGRVIPNFKVRELESDLTPFVSLIETSSKVGTWREASTVPQVSEKMLVLRPLELTNAEKLRDR